MNNSEPKICLKCILDLGFLKNLPIELLKSLKVKKIENGFELCSKCKKKINEYYIYENYEMELLNEIAKYISRIISGQIHSCSACTISRDYSGDYGEADFVSLLIEDNFGEVPEKILNLIDNKYKLICSGCLGGKRYGRGLLDDVWTVETNGYYFDSYQSKFKSNELLYEYANQIDVSLNDFDIKNFEYSLRENLMLAYKSEIGQKIFNLIKSRVDKKDFILDKGSKLYRGRKRKKNDSNFLSNDLWEPPYNMTSQGRFNLRGSSVLYTSNDIGAIPYELNLAKGECIDIATFKTKIDLNLFDI